MPVVFINFFGIFPRQLPKRMEREDANLPSLQLWRKSCNKRALEASSWTMTNVLRKKIGTMCAKLQRGKRKSGSFGAKRLTNKWRAKTCSVRLFYHELDNYFIESERERIPKIPTWWIFTRFATLSVAVTTTGWKFLVFVLVFFLNKTPVEKTSSEYRFGTLLSLAAVMFTSVNYH